MVGYEPRGKYYEDFNIGDEFCSQSRTVTEADIVSFAGLSGDYMQLHTSEQYAAETIHKGRIAHGLLTMAISSGQNSLAGLLEGTVVAFLNCTMSWSNVVRPGDTIRTIRVVKEKRKVKRPGMGIITFENLVYNQNDVVVMKHEDVLMIKCREE